MTVGLLLAGRTRLDDAPRAFLAHAAAWFAAHCPETLIASVIDEDGGHARLRLRLHPAAEDVAIVAAGQQRIVVATRTSGGGPGYHRYLCDALRRFGEETHIDWTPSDAGEGIGDPTGYFDGGSPEAVDEAMLAWLRESAARLAERSEEGLGLSMPPGYEFALGTAIATPLGPRDRAWLKAIAADPARGADVFPWWDDGLSPRMLLDRARCRLWTDVRWRPPFFDSERESLRATAADLEAAWRAEPGLDFPWREWREVLAWLGVGGTLAEEVRRRALVAASGPTLGYRRGDVRVSLPGGWSLRVPGSLAESTSADGTWQAVDHRRRISFRAIDASSADDGMPGAEELLDSRPHAADERLELAGGRVRGRATFSVRDGRGVLTALCAVPGRVAICTISFDEADDREWAIDTWRSVENPGAALH